MGQSWTGERVLELSRSYQRSQALLAAAELGVYGALGGERRSAVEVAAALAADRRGITILLDALTALGLLAKDGDRYRVPVDLMPLLVTPGDANVLPMVHHQATCAHRWDRLDEVVRTGVSAPRASGRELDAVQRRAFIDAMHVIGREMAPGVVAKLEPARFRQVLDVGGGSAVYTTALLEAAPAMRATLFDLPPVIEMTRERLAGLGLLERVMLVAGDFDRDPLPGGHDLVLLSAIIHQNSSAENRALYARCREALVPGGTIVVRDILMDESRTVPVAGALFAINMLVATDGGGTYTFPEIRADLEAAGFADVRLVQQGSGMDGLVTARRPG